MRNRQEYNKRSTDLQKKMQLKGEVRPAMSGDLINSFSASEMCDPLHEVKMGRGRQGQSEGGGGAKVERICKCTHVHVLFLCAVLQHI